MPFSTVILDANIRIPVFEPFRKVNVALLDLLRSLTDEDWHKPTVHPDRNVKDLTAHLLQGSLGRVSGLRDGYRPPVPPITGKEDLVAWIQRNNREFMTAMRRVSPRILADLIAVYDREMLAAFEVLDPDAEGLGVAWAGEAVSRNWFDIAREYTEKWHHQQQIRDATGRPPLYQGEFLTPVLETFARGLPHAFRSRAVEDGTHIAVAVTGPVTLGWTLQYKGEEWTLWSGAESGARASVSIPADIAWRVWTRGTTRDEAREHMEVSGDETMAEPILSFVAIMA